MLQALGYKQMGAVLAGRLSLAEATDETVRGYLRLLSLVTWFRKEPAVALVEPPTAEGAGGPASLAGAVGAEDRASDRLR